ncbi:MAG TPA: DUF4389 domain-containing protein [Gemmatimonadaceae bacterium]
MSAGVSPFLSASTPRVRVDVQPALDRRNRLTTAFRLLLALPHLVLVGGPIAGAVAWNWGPSRNQGVMEGGAFGVLAAVVTMVAWFAILFTGEHPKGLWDLVAYYLRWRVRAIAYTALLRDEYPPFGEGQYAVTVEIPQPEMPRDRLTVAFRLVLSIPHLIIIWALGLAWGLTTVVAWFAILLTGRYPAALYDFAVGVLRWTTRVEAYLLLLDDDYPPFSLL